MKITHEKTTIELDNRERQLLQTAMHAIVDLTNTSIRNKQVKSVLRKAGIDNWKEVSDLRDLATGLSEEL